MFRSCDVEMGKKALHSIYLLLKQLSAEATSRIILKLPYQIPALENMILKSEKNLKMIGSSFPVDAESKGRQWKYKIVQISFAISTTVKQKLIILFTKTVNKATRY